MFICNYTVTSNNRTVKSHYRGRRHSDHMVVGFITTYAISAYPH
jgi:hypothetical protein